MSVQDPYDELLARFRAEVGNETLSHRCVVTFPAGGMFIAVLREAYASLVDGAAGLTLTEQPACSGSLYAMSVEEAYFSARGDGVVKLREARGFTVGVGETLTYLLLVAGDVRIELEDWWEDNVAGPDCSVFTLRARSPERLRDALSALRYAVIKCGAPWKDPFARAPKRTDRARVETAARSFAEPALAWAALAPPNPRWTFVEEVFETCSSCSGSGLDPYAGACYGCSHNGKVVSGYRWTPHPPSMRHVIGFASDLAAMLQVDAAMCTLLERLAPWGRSAATNIEWLAEEPSHPGGSAPDWIPNCMVPVFKALRAALEDPTIPEGGLSLGWFSQGTRAWQNAAHRKPFAERKNPFEPLGTIVGAGYRLIIVGSETIPAHVRLSVDV